MVLDFKVNARLVVAMTINFFFALTAAPALKLGAWTKSARRVGGGCSCAEAWGLNKKRKARWVE